MNVSLDLLRVFKIVAYYNSISKASDVLCVTQPSVSKSIKKLESELGVNLFIRERKGMRLTEDGKRVYRHIIDSINILDKTELIAKEISELESGNLRIGASLSATKHLLVDAVADFKKLYPHINIKILNSPTDKLYNDLRYEKLDIIFINSTFNVSERYIKEPVCEIEDCFFVSKKYYDKVKGIKDIESFVLENMIIQNEGFDTRTFFVNKCLKNNSKFIPILEIDRNAILVDFVLKDLGVGFATKQFIQEYLDTDKIVELKTNFNIEKRKVNAVYRNNKNKKVAKLLELVKYYQDKENR